MQGKKREAGSLPASLVFLLLSLFMGPHRRTAAGCHCLLFGVLLGCGAEGIWKSEAGGGRRAIIVLGSRRTEWCSPLLSEPALQSFSLCSCVHGVLAGGAEGKRTEGEAGSRC